jgi:uncharacterized protein YecT (DUF1311 family)
MIRPAHLPLFALLFAAPLSGLAGTDARDTARSDLAHIETALVRCLESEDGQSNQGMIGCTLQAYEANDRVLNRVYKDIVAELKAQNDADARTTLARLQKAQRAWIAFRDANSDLHGTMMLNGSGERLVAISASNSMVTARVLELVEIFESR